MHDRKLVGSRQRSPSSRFILLRRERPLLAGNGGPGLLVILKKKAVTQYLSLTPRSFVSGLVSAAVTGVTRPWVMQLVDIVGAAVIYLNLD